ncbi:MAG: hypothetical protein V4532_09560 [Pseudomonadota bacterium]
MSLLIMSAKDFSGDWAQANGEMQSSAASAAETLPTRKTRAIFFMVGVGESAAGQNIWRPETRGAQQDPNRGVYLQPMARHGNAPVVTAHHLHMKTLKSADRCQFGPTKSARCLHDGDQ